MPDGDQRRHVQSPTEVTTTTSTDPRFPFDRGLGTEPTRIESAECNPLAYIQCLGQRG